MWTCWFYKCATISPALPKHCHEPWVLHSRCLLLIIEKLIGFMSGTGQYQPSSAIIIGMLAGSRSCFTSNNSSMLLHSPLKRWKLEEYGYHWGAGPAISPAQIFTHTHMNQGASREVCVTMKVRERECEQRATWHTDRWNQSQGTFCVFTVSAGAAGNTSLPFSLLNTRHGAMQVSFRWAST